VTAGTRIPAADIAALVRDGVSTDLITEFYPGVSAAAAAEADDFARYFDSFVPARDAA